MHGGKRNHKINTRNCSFQETVLHATSCKERQSSRYSRTGKQRGEPAYSCPSDFILPMRTATLSLEPTEVQACSSVSMMLSQMVSTRARSQWPEQWMIASLHSQRLNGSQNSSYNWQHKDKRNSRGSGSGPSVAMTGASNSKTTQHQVAG